MLLVQSKKSECNTKVIEIENKITNDRDHDIYIYIYICVCVCVCVYITSQEFNKLTAETFTARLAIVQQFCRDFC